MNDGSVDDDSGMKQEGDVGEENQPADDATPETMDDGQVPDNALESRASACDENDDEAKESDDEVSPEEAIAPA